MRKINSKILGGVLATTLSLATTAGMAQATMTAPNVENFHTMPLIITRVAYDEPSLTVVLRDEAIKHINIVTIDYPTYKESEADRNYEQMREEPVYWGKTVVNMETAELPINQEVVVPAVAGTDFYNDLREMFYYSVVYNDGRHFEGKVLYGGRCRSPLGWGGFDMETMEPITYDDTVYECRVGYFQGTYGISKIDESESYMSEYTKVLWDQYGWNIPTTYEYDLALKSEPMTGLPEGVKTLEQVALEKEEKEKGNEAGLGEVINTGDAPAQVNSKRSNNVSSGLDGMEEQLALDDSLGLIGGEEILIDGDEATIRLPECNCNSAKMPALENKTQNWWLLIPLTALATFLACWWLLPEKREKKLW